MYVYVHVVNTILLCRHSPITDQGYYGCAVGKGRELAKTEMEKYSFKDMTAREALHALATMYVTQSPIKYLLFHLLLLTCWLTCLLGCTRTKYLQSQR
jgi:hypothetical protein